MGLLPGDFTSGGGGICPVKYIQPEGPANRIGPPLVAWNPSTTAFVWHRSH
jgi:hypothetical protein